MWWHLQMFAICHVTHATYTYNSCKQFYWNIFDVLVISQNNPKGCETNMVILLVSHSQEVMEYINRWTATKDVNRRGNHFSLPWHLSCWTCFEYICHFLYSEYWPSQLNQNFKLRCVFSIIQVLRRSNMFAYFVSYKSLKIWSESNICAIWMTRKGKSFDNTLKRIAYLDTYGECHRNFPLLWFAFQNSISLNSDVKEII